MDPMSEDYQRCPVFHVNDYGRAGVPGVADRALTVKQVATWTGMGTVMVPAQCSGHAAVNIFRNTGHKVNGGRRKYTDAICGPSVHYCRTYDAQPHRIRKDTGIARIPSVYAPRKRIVHLATERSAVRLNFRRRTLFQVNDGSLPYRQISCMLQSQRTEHVFHSIITESFSCNFLKDSL